MDNNEFIEKIKGLAVSVFEGTTGSKLILFGSRARGDLELGYRNGFDVQPQLFSYEEWKKQSITPFYKNIEEDGIVIFEN